MWFVISSVLGEADDYLSPACVLMSGVVVHYILLFESKSNDGELSGTRTLLSFQTCFCCIDIFADSLSSSHFRHAVNKWTRDCIHL